MSYRRLLVLAAIAGLPGIAQAQFTTFIPQRNRATDSTKAVAVAQRKAQVDTSIQKQLTNMKTWVDSAAGMPARPAAAPATGADSVAMKAAMTDSLQVRTAAVATARNTPVAAAAPTLTTAQVAPVAPVASASHDSTMTNGAKAPATATQLPLLVLLGALSLFVGTILIRGGPTPVRVRADRTRRHNRA